MEWRSRSIQGDNQAGIVVDIELAIPEGKQGLLGLSSRPLLLHGMKQ